MGSFFQFLENFNYWQVVVLVLMLSAITLIVALATNPTVRWKSFVFTIGSQKKGKRCPPHAYCANRSDLLVLDAQEKAVSREIDKILNVKIMKGMMKETEVQLEKAREVLENNYEKMLSDRLPGNHVTAHRDYLDYCVLVEVMLSVKIKNCVRSTYIDSRIPEPGSLEFEQFVKETAEHLFNVGSSYMDLWYVTEGRMISRELLKKAVREKRPMFADLTRNVFTRAKEVDMRYKRQIKDMEKHLREKEREILGFELL